MTAVHPWCALAADWGSPPRIRRRRRRDQGMRRFLGPSSALLLCTTPLAFSTAWLSCALGCRNAHVPKENTYYIRVAHGVVFDIPDAAFTSATYYHKRPLAISRACRPTASPDNVVVERRSAIVNALAVLFRLILFFLCAVEAFVIGAGFAFRAAYVAEAAALYDLAWKAGFPEPLLWQRGIALFYAGRFLEASNQFRKDAELKTFDPEESMWTMLCESRVIGFSASRAQMLSVSPSDVVKRKRPELLTALELYSGRTGTESSLRAVLEDTAACDGADGFRAAFYLGLFEEARGDTASARLWITRAVSMEYGRTGSDYLINVARVHMKVRGWEESA